METAAAIIISGVSDVQREENYSPVKVQEVEEEVTKIVKEIDTHYAEDPSLEIYKNFEVDGPNANSSDLPPDMRFNSAHVISISAYSFLFAVSFAANFTVLRILIRRYKKTKSRVNLLLIHLAIADLLVTCLMMPLEIGWASTVMWRAGDLLCRFFSFFRIFGLFLSSNILICISLDRFYAIVAPLASGKTSQKVRIFLAFAWVLAILSASPQVYIFHVETHPNITWYTQCVTFNSFPSQSFETAYTIFGMVMMYLLPLLVIVITYTCIIVTIYRQSKLASDTSNTDGLRRSGAGVLNRARTRTLKMTVVMVCVFIFCWTPYYIITLWFLIDKASFMSVDQRIQNSLFIFACTNSVMNPIVYGFYNLRKRKTSNRLQMHQDTRSHVYHCSTATPRQGTMQRGGGRGGNTLQATIHTTTTRASPPMRRYRMKSSQIWSHRFRTNPPKSGHIDFVQILPNLVTHHRSNYKRRRASLTVNNLNLMPEQTFLDVGGGSGGSLSKTTEAIFHQNHGEAGINNSNSNSSFRTRRHNNNAAATTSSKSGNFKHMMRSDDSGFEMNALNNPHVSLGRLRRLEDSNGEFSIIL